MQTKALRQEQPTPNAQIIRKTKRVQLSIDKLSTSDPGQPVPQPNGVTTSRVLRNQQLAFSPDSLSNGSGDNNRFPPINLGSESPEDVQNNLLISHRGGITRGSDRVLNRILSYYRCFELVYQAGDYPYIQIRTPNIGVKVPRSTIASSSDPKLRRANKKMGYDGNTIPNKIMQLAAHKMRWRNMLDPTLQQALGFGVHGCSPYEANKSARNLLCIIRKVVRSVEPRGGFLASKPSRRDRALYAIGSRELEKGGWPIIHVMTDLRDQSTW